MTLRHQHSDRIFLSLFFCQLPSACAGLTKRWGQKRGAISCRWLAWLVISWLVASVDLQAAEAPFFPALARQTDASPRLTGMTLLSELGCAACHASPNTALAPKPAPDLSAIGARVNTAHLRRFIASPSSVKLGTTMPDMLAHLPEGERATTAEALAHYLASLGGAAPAFTKPVPEAVERGRKLYHSVGCVACHSPESPLPDSVPLGPVDEKYSVASLTKFLEDPLAVRPGGRMPDLKLDHFEAQDIASFLLRNQTPLDPDFSSDPQLAARGRALFTQHRCDACHTVGGGRTQPVGLPALSHVRPELGCLSAQAGAWPRYALSDSQRAAIRAALAAQAEPVSVAENVTLTLTRLNCLACHQRGVLGGVPANRDPHFTGKDENLGDQGRLPPPLTGVGAKLKREWLRDVVANGASVRPYLHTRMPKFGAANSEVFAGWLKELDTLPPAAFARAAKSDKPHEIGRELAGSKAFNCIACHTFREKSAAAIRALDLMPMTERLEENWFHHYLASPQRFSPLTIMPAFWPDGKSPLPDVLGGDPGKQRDALWQYLARGPEAREPQGLVLEPLVLEVKSEAVILRRAFPGIGKRGIGVGYPGGINLSFDAEQMRLGSMWSGGFIEASSLWRGQGAGQARILGRDTVNFPPGPAFAVLASADAPWPVIEAKEIKASPDAPVAVEPRAIAPADSLAFKGYSLDAQRRPTFRYQLGEVSVEDSFLDVKAGAGKPHFVRSVRFPHTLPPGLYFRVAADKSIAERGANSFAVGQGLLVKLSLPGFVRTEDGAKELLMPVKDSFTVEYHLIDKR
jgi:mono/diheme cytochrome c family protein